MKIKTKIDTVKNTFLIKYKKSSGDWCQEEHFSENELFMRMRTLLMINDTQKTLKVRKDILMEQGD